MWTVDAGAVAQGHLRERAWGWIFPVLGVAALAAAWWRRRGRGATDCRSPSRRCSSSRAFATLGVMFWPFMVPYALTVGDAAAPDASLRFLFYGGVVVLPVIAAYTIGVYWVFRGKVGQGCD